MRAVRCCVFLLAKQLRGGREKRNQFEQRGKALTGRRIQPPPPPPLFKEGGGGVGGGGGREDEGGDRDRRG